MHILIVEDEPDSAEMLRMLLAMQGHAVSVALTGEAAMVLTAHTHPDLVIVDLMLPDMDGIEIIRALQPTATPRTCTCIALTNSDDPAMRAEATAAGVDHYVLKSEDIGKLLALIADLADGVAG